MSCTEMVFFNKDGAASEKIELENSWRGAMAIWSFLSEKYLHRKLSFGSNIQEVVNLCDNETVSIQEKICLMTTLDKVLVKEENFEKVLMAFRAFEGNTSLKEQADVLESRDDVIAVGWNQTSVSENFWLDREKPYNCITEEEHWWLFEELPDHTKEVKA
jgi:hypothetical protein